MYTIDNETRSDNIWINTSYIHLKRLSISNHRLMSCATWYNGTVCMRQVRHLVHITCDVTHHDSSTAQRSHFINTLVSRWRQDGQRHVSVKSHQHWPAGTEVDVRHVVSIAAAVTADDKRKDRVSITRTTRLHIQAEPDPQVAPKGPQPPLAPSMYRRTSSS